jgi:hypothetical protein
MRLGGSLLGSYLLSQPRRMKRSGLVDGGQLMKLSYEQVVATHCSLLTLMIGVQYHGHFRGLDVVPRSLIPTKDSTLSLE